MTVTIDARRNAPIAGCNCKVCAFFNRVVADRIAQDKDLAENYSRYTAGELVAKPGKE